MKRSIETFVLALVATLMMLFVCTSSFAATCNQVSRTNLAPNSILTSSEYNGSLNTLYTAHNAFDAGCIAAGTIDDPASFSSSDFGALLNGIKEGCVVTNTDANTISVDRCMLSVNGKMVRTTTATTVTWGCGANCDSETASTVYYVYAIGTSSGTTLTLGLKTTAPNADGYDASNNRVLAQFTNNAGSNIEAVLNADQGNVFKKSWFVAANISGANPSLGTSTVSTYTGIEDSGLTLTAQSGSLLSYVPCSSTNDSTGTTCSAGNEMLGVAAFIPTTGRIEVCAQFGHNIANGVGGSLSAAFQVVETPNSAQTISSEGGARMESGNSTASSTLTHPNNTCGIFNISAVGKKTFRVFYEQTAGGTVSQSLVTADAAAGVGQRDFRITIQPIQ